jgi:putative salt-induced outer membrane protein
MTKIIKIIFLALAFLTFQNQAFANEVNEAKDLQDKKLRTSIEGGITVENGNSKTQAVYGNLRTDYKFSEKWKDILRFRGENKVENSIRSKEYYRINNQASYLFTKSNYALIESEYIDDRFGGYDYRVSQTFGLGRDLFKTDEFSLSFQAGIGGRQIKLINEQSENLMTGRFALHSNWQLSKVIYFNEDLDISFDKEATITRSESNLKIQINSTLYLKLSYLIENRSSVPIGVKNTDNRTMIIVGYEF